ncbi:MAG: SulP family inorganic anion transporter, partial [Bacteroidota bacterium]|nr:SulP family inorganic anion transporter [Bacteroidota bacterium]
IILISKQIPPLIGYDKPEFWSNELFNILTFHNMFSNVRGLYENTTLGVMVIGTISFLFIFLWNRYLAKKIPYIPSTFLIVVLGILLAILFNKYVPALALKSTQMVSIPHDVLATTRFPKFQALFSSAKIWRDAVVICFVASLETLLSLEAIDKLDPYNRISPQNRELIAQGTGNFLSGLLGGIPITAVIVRSSANAEAGARTWLSAFVHGVLLFLVVLFGVSLVNMIPYCVLAVILVRTGYNLAKPKMVYGIYKQGREQLLPFLITVVAILFTDLLIGVLIGLVYSIYFLIKHTYRAGFALKEAKEGHITHYNFDLALNVSFLNKKRTMDALDRIPEYSVVKIDGSDSVYIDNDILEIFQDYRSKARNRHIQLNLINIPEVQTIEIH